MRWVLIAAGVAFLGILGLVASRSSVHRPAPPQLIVQGDAWEIAKQSNDAQTVADYISTHPASPHEQDAYALFYRLMAGQDDVAVPAPILESLMTIGAALDREAINQILTYAPKFAPIEGLPDALWKTKTCNECHSWTAETLCAQALAYTQVGFDPKSANSHPFGPAFKHAMKNWRANGCR